MRLWRLVFVAGMVTSNVALAYGGHAAIPSGQFYVSASGNDGSGNGGLSAPYATPEKAQTVAEGMLAGGICPIATFEGGNSIANRTRYLLTSGLTFGTADAGTPGCTVTWQSASGEYASFDGGTQITGWTQCTDSGVPCEGGSAGLYKASVSLGTVPRELYVNDIPATRARGAEYPSGWTVNTGTTGQTTLTAPDSTVAGYGNLADVEIHIETSWAFARCHVNPTGTSGTTVTLINPCGSVFQQDAATNPLVGITVAWVENAAELLTSANCPSGGCWYLNQSTNVLYYLPRSGETSGGSLTVPVWAPQLTSPIIGGTLQNIAFNRLTIEDDEFADQGNNGVVAADNDILCPATSCDQSDPTTLLPNLVMYPAAIDVTATNVALNHDLIWHDGGRGVRFAATSNTETLYADDIEQNGAGDRQFGDPYDCSNITASTQTYGLTESDTILGEPLEYYSVSPSYVGCARNVSTSNDQVTPRRVAFNNGYFLPAGGPNYTGSIAITDNYVDGFCSESAMYDCGAMHFYGTYSPQVTISGNYVHGLDSGTYSASGGFYPDDSYTGSMSITGNVIDGINPSPGTCTIVDAPTSCWLRVRLSTMENVTATANYDLLGLYDDADSNTISGNTTLTSDACNGGALTACQAIINAAGIQPGVTPGP